MEKILDKIGFFGPLINFIIVITNTWNQTPYLLSYLVFFYLEIMLNRELKIQIKQERPTNGKSLFAIEKYEGAERYGMPSLHAQSVIFSTVYLYLVNQKKIYWVLIELFISALTIYQRWSYRRHTIEQLAAGSLLGAIIASISYFTTKKILHLQYKISIE